MAIFINFIDKFLTMISIIGAGPAGNYLAYLLAKNKQEVEVFEEHPKIGLPIQCTGIVTSAILKFVPLKKEFVINQIKKVKVYFPNKKFIEFNLSSPNLILDREKFDKYLAEQARKQGAKYYLNHKFIDYQENKIILKSKKLVKKQTDILVGADGPFSKVAKISNLYGERKFVSAVQARVSIKTEKDTVEFWLFPEGFSWVVPESNSIARIGTLSYTNTEKYFKEFLNSRARNSKIKEYQSGLIPVYNPKQIINKNNIYLLGDAAAQVKATTFGGIVQGLTAAEALSESILKKKNYKKLCKNLNKELKYGLLIRKILNKFSEQEYNDLIRLVSTEKCRKIIQNIDRDYPSKLIFKLIISQPKLLKFTKKLF